MVDSIEIRLDQLTEAIKGLYAKSSMSQGEIYNALTSLSQRYENLTNVSSEKIATTLVNEFRKTIDLKYGQTNQYLKDLENSIKNFVSSHLSQSPKMAAEITKLLTDTSNTYAKLNAQDLALQKIFNTLEQQKGDNSTPEITKLSENFMTFSRGFENITSTLNKNFADFLSQIKQANTKEDLNLMKSDLDNIAGNINSIISAISIIDAKYKDLTGLIDAIAHRENIFNDALREVRALAGTVNSLKDNIKAVDPKIELEAINSEIKTQTQSVKQEIQKVLNAATDNSLRIDLNNISSNVSNVSLDLNNLSKNIVSTKDELKNLSSNLVVLGSEVKDVRGLINDEILYKAHQQQGDFERYLNSVKEDIKVLLAGLTTFKNDITAINEGNIKVLQEPIERAMESLKNQELGKNIKELSDNLRDVTIEIQSSIQNMQTSLNDMNSVSSMQILTQISEAIPSIADKLEIFRTHVVTENSANLGQIRTTFQEVIANVRDSLKDAVDKISDDTKTLNIETMDSVKVDLQRLSDHLVESVDSVIEKVQSEFAGFKADFQEFTIKQQDSVERVSDKLSNLEVSLENFSNDTIEKLNDTLNANSAHSQDVLNEIKSDILEGILNIDKSTKGSLSQFEVKIDKILDNYLGSTLDNIADKKSLRETVVDIETKIDRTNLQQIHNAKELLEEIQSTSTNLSMKLANMEENKDYTSLLNAISKISERIQGIEEFNSEFSEEMKQTKEQIEQKLKDNVQKISALVDKPKENSDLDKQSTNLDNLSNKVQEYLSNFEFLKSNISQEIKENLASEFTKLDNEIKKIRSSGDNSNYSYTLEDVESDLTKIRLSIEKTASDSLDLKNLFEKIVELRTVGLENVKINRDVEAELGNLTGWLKDVLGRVSDVSDKLEDIQSGGFEEIKSRLVQSEKTKTNAIEFNARVENALKHVIKNAQNQESKIAELNRKLDLLMQAQADSFNPSQFIDIFYENMTQTKMLANRVEIIEDKINTIHSTVQRLMNYVEQ